MPKVKTIEQTGKGWKGLQAIGCLGSLAGLTTLIVGISMANQGTKASAIGMMILFVGVPTYLFARIGSWWFHG